MHQRRHRELRGDHHVHGPEFARFDTALDDAGHEPVPACHDFFVIEAGKLGEIVGFRHHQLRDADERRLTDETPVLAHETLEQIASAAGEGPGQLLALGNHGDDGLPDQRLEERLFVFEIEVDRALGDAGTACDFLELGGGKAPVGKDLQRGADDLFRTGILPAAPTGFCECTGHLGSKVSN